jgi:hypothetical protein
MRTAFGSNHGANDRNRRIQLRVAACRVQEAGQLMGQVQLKNWTCPIYFFLASHLALHPAGLSRWPYSPPRRVTLHVMKARGPGPHTAELCYFSNARKL